MKVANAAEVPVFRLDFEDDFRAQFLQGCDAILKSDALAEGTNVRAFERAFAALVGARHGIAVNSGTAALEVALRALDVRGKEVIIPTNTFIATAIGAERAGATVTLLDIEEQAFALNPEQLEKTISEKTGAVVVVHIGGAISPFIEEIVRICGRHGVPLVEDAAHAHGSRRGEWQAGTIGAVGCFSFFPTKVMTTGEGGMITTNDDRIAEAALSIKNFGRDPRNSLLCVNEGYNCKVTEFVALMGVLELQRLPARIAKRRALSREYSVCLEGTRFDTGNTNRGLSSCYKQIVRTRLSQSALHRFCKERGVSLTGEVYRFPVHQQPIFERRFDKTRFPIANEFAKSHICPPLYPELDIDDIRHVCAVLQAAEREYGK